MVLTKTYSSSLLLFYVILLHFNKALSAVTSCRSRLTGISGTFTSPNYPREYVRPDGLEEFVISRPGQEKFIKCQWEIEVPQDKGIQLKFGHFDLNAPLDECDKGEVDVFSGVGKQKSRLDKYCPGNRPDTVTSHYNSITVVFRRPINFSGTGFLISYIAITPGETITDFITCSDAGSDYTRVESYSITCPSGCANITRHPVIGNLPYREDSHICRAAVHAGVISDALGGRVKVKRETGVSLYHGSTANNVSATTGPMADFQMTFPSVKTCHSRIDLRGSQFSASSYLNETDFYGRIESWFPSKGLLSYPDGAWSPGDVTKPQWLQVDLKKMMNVTGIITRGSTNFYTFTKSFSVKYSNNSITWWWYKEEGQSKAKIFGGNKNSFSEVRNNFVRPTILARYVRVYPTILVDKDLPKQAMKLTLTGCQVLEDDYDIDDIPPPPPPPITTTTTTPSTTTTSVPFSPTTLENIIANNTTAGAADEEESEKIATTNATILIDESFPGNIDETADKPPGVNGTDLNERSIIIIGIVAALAVTSILLATLVLFLVRKRKKEPKHDTSIPKPTSQNNATYHATIGMPYAPNNNNNKKERKQNKKKGKSRTDNRNDSLPLTGMALENSFARGSVTLPYDQLRQPLVNKFEKGQSGSTTSLQPSNSKNATGTSKLLPSNHEACGFNSDDGDHEYQVILDPVCDYNEQLLSSKASTGSSFETHCKTSESGPCQQETVWGKAGDAWSKDSTPEKRQLTSFVPSQNSNSPSLVHSGSFSRRNHFSINESNSNSVFAKANPKQYLRSNSRGHPSAQNSSSFPYGPSYQRFSSSSTGSSAHSKSEGSSNLRRNPSSSPSTAYYPSVSPDSKTSYSNRESEFVFAQSNSQPQLGEKYPPKLSNDDHIYPSVFSPVSNGSFLNRQQNPNFPLDGVNAAESSCLPVNNSQSRNNYDQLYRKKTTLDPKKTSVTVASNNYDQLNLNTSV